MYGLADSIGHRRLIETALSFQSNLKFITFGLTESNAKARNLVFINEKNILFNIDNDKSKLGSGVWGVETLSSDNLPNIVDDSTKIIIMADAIHEIGRQLDDLGIKEYYSSLLLGQIYHFYIVENEILKADGVLIEMMKCINEPVLYCARIGDTIRFAMDDRNNVSVLQHCSSALGLESKNLYPNVCEFSGGKFPIETYLSSFRSFIINNIAGIGECRGCKRLGKGKPKVAFRQFKNIWVSHYRRCQLRCTHCSISTTFDEVQTDSYPILPVFGDMMSKGVVASDATIYWSGSEPTLYNSFENDAAFIKNRGFYQSILSNSVKRSKMIGKILQDGMGCLITSVESGTAETFKSIKGVDCFDAVWENLGWYSEIAAKDASKRAQVIAKYIILDENRNEKDLQGFVDRCIKNSIMNIQVTGDVEVTRRGEKIAPASFDAAKYIYNAATSKGVRVGIFNFPGYEAEIDNLG